MMNYTGVSSAGGGFNPLAAGTKMYGSSGRSMPTMGPVDPTGYATRDRTIQARRNAMIAQIKAMQGQNYMSAANLGGPLQNG